MELIQSFSVDHIPIVPGICQVDRLGNDSVTTLRYPAQKAKTGELVIDVAAMHFAGTYHRDFPTGLEG